jgi:hypothetical protein
MTTGPGEKDYGPENAVGRPRNPGTPMSTGRAGPALMVLNRGNVVVKAANGGSGDAASRRSSPMMMSMTEASEHVGSVMSVNAGDLEGVLSADEVAEAWLAELTDQIAVPASAVQDHLLDLWGALDEGPVRAEVERWLTETLRRNLYSVSDINERLEGLLPAS